MNDLTTYQKAILISAAIASLALFIYDPVLLALVAAFAGLHTVKDYYG